MTADGAERVANDVCDFRYKARAMKLAPGEQRMADSAPLAETQILVATGLLTMMVDGFTAQLGAGEFVRVAPGRHFGWRNDTADIVEVLFHSVRSGDGVCRALKINAPVPPAPAAGSS